MYRLLLINRLDVSLTKVTPSTFRKASIPLCVSINRTLSTLEEYVTEPNAFNRLNVS